MRCIPFLPMPGAAQNVRLTPPKQSSTSTLSSAVEDWQPDFQSLVNYPKQQHVRAGGVASPGSSLSPGTRCTGKARATGNCVMCNKLCLLGSASAKPSNNSNNNKVNADKQQSEDEEGSPVSQSTAGEKQFITVQQEEEAKLLSKRDNDKERGMAYIPKQNKGLCTNCDITVWVISKNGLMIKWCKGCKNFRLWEAFGAKGRATKCTKCRTRQREKYASQKELRKKQKSPDTVIQSTMRRMCHDFDAAQAALSLTELSK